MTEYEVYRERYRITEWRPDTLADGTPVQAIYRTEFMDKGWFDDAEVRANKPGDTNIIFVVSNDTDPLVHIRAKRHD